ncbi:hypothetical protein F2Q70_00044346 [Brassica cretica]|uniref:Phytocyanin domain-containing protein n=1 Tax=Brassica cretica TaxID=69181 RepID=A0A8S9KJL3_BRACR|nr:hypothetical protein F2Q70_00044346 [Brassica cretica]
MKVRRGFAGDGRSRMAEIAVREREIVERIEREAEITKKEEEEKLYLTFPTDTGSLVFRRALLCFVVAVNVEWASKTTFHVGDVLVFEYNNMTNRRHDVYLQTNVWSYKTCNFESRNKIASSEENGSKESFKFTLAMSQPYSFACGENNGYYCRTYNMKFSVLPGA